MSWMPICTKAYFANGTPQSFWLYYAWPLWMLSIYSYESSLHPVLLGCWMLKVCWIRINEIFLLIWIVIISNGATFLIPVFILCKVLAVGWVNQGILVYWQNSIVLKEVEKFWGEKYVKQKISLLKSCICCSLVTDSYLGCFVGNSILQFINFWTSSFCTLMFQSAWTELETNLEDLKKQPKKPPCMKLHMLAVVLVYVSLPCDTWVIHLS